MAYNLLPGKTVIVSGSSTGIGRAIAIRARFLPSGFVQLNKGTKSLRRMVPTSCCITLAPQHNPISKKSLARYTRPAGRAS